MKPKPKIVFQKQRNKMTKNARLEGPWIIHKNGTRSPLWSCMGDVWLREDRRYNLQWSERTYWNLTRAWDKVFKVWQREFNAVRKAKGACCKVSKKHGYDKEKWIRWEVHNYGDSATISSEVVDMESPLEFVGQQRLFNVDIGTRYLEVDVKLNRLRQWRSRAREILERAFKICCPELDNPTVNGITKVTVNGRDYYFSRTMIHSKFTEVKPILFAGEGDFMEIVK